MFRDHVSLRNKEWVSISILFLLFLLLQPVYFALNRSQDTVLSIQTPVDSLIPFFPLAGIVYLSYFIFLVITSVLLGRTSLIALKQWLFALVIATIVAYAVYATFQSYVPRPDITGLDSVQLMIMQTIYGNDKPYNALPSLHATLTACSVIAIGLWQSSLRSRQIMYVWGALIVLSTLLVKQHFILDAVSGIILAVLAVTASLHVFPAKKAEDN